MSGMSLDQPGAFISYGGPSPDEIAWASNSYQDNYPIERLRAYGAGMPNPVDPNSINPSYQGDLNQLPFMNPYRNPMPRHQPAWGESSFPMEDVYLNRDVLAPIRPGIKNYWQNRFMNEMDVPYAQAFDLPQALPQNPTHPAVQAIIAALNQMPMAQVASGGDMQYGVPSPQGPSSINSFERNPQYDAMMQNLMQNLPYFGGVLGGME